MASITVGVWLLDYSIVDGRVRCLREGDEVLYEEGRFEPPDWVEQVCEWICEHGFYGQGHAFDHWPPLAAYAKGFYGP